MKKQLPRIPFTKDSRAFSELGKKLAELHLNYETLKPYKLKETKTGEVNYYVTKMNYASKTDKTKIIYNRTLTLENIPEKTHRYIVNGKSALDWREEQNNPEYIVNVIKRIVYLSVENVKIIELLSELGI